MKRPLDIHPLVKKWLLQRRSNASSSRQVNHDLRAILLEDLREARQITNIRLNELVSSVSLDLRQITMFDLGGVEIIHLIEQDQLVPLIQKPFREVRADKARATSEENFHGNSNGELRMTKCQVRR